jgi:O-antigen ligase
MRPAQADTANETGQTGVDAVAALSFYTVLLMALPARLVVGTLGSAGSPASLFAIGCLLWWIWEALRRAPALPTAQFYPVRLLAGCLTLCIAMSYIVAMRRPINGTEVAAADRGLLSFAGWMGVLMLAHDGVSNVARLHTFIRRLAILGGWLAALAIVQFVTGQSIVDLIKIPGLSSTSFSVGVVERNGFNRPSATAISPIEFSVVITMLLPLALVNGRIQDGRAALRRWLPVVLMMAVVPIAMSRSAIVGALVALVIIIPALPRAQRWLLLVGSVLAAVVTFVAVPGVMGSTLRLFTGIKDDGSAQSRTDSYEIVWEYFMRNPLFGRGLFTFLPSHRILDNQYLGLLLDIGLVGLCAVVGLLLAAVASGLDARHDSSVATERELAQALVASIMVGAVGFAVFDGLGFPMAAGLLFLVMGLVGALWRLVRSDGWDVSSVASTYADQAPTSQ